MSDAPAITGGLCPGTIPAARFRPTYMGVVNLSPDSGYGAVAGRGEFISKAEELLSCGAGILDIGAVSTRPGADPVSVREEWSRLEPALGWLRDIRGEFTLSVDTSSSEIVRRVLALTGPFIVNDVTAGRDDPSMLDTVRTLGLRYVAMHSRGNPRTMDGLCDYPDGVMNELNRFFTAFADRAEGIDWILDPGLGFAKTASHCWEILEHLSELRRFGRPVLVSCSDKRFTRTRPECDAEALATKGGADIIRVHKLLPDPKKNTIFGGFCTEFN